MEKRELWAIEIYEDGVWLPCEDGYMSKERALAGIEWWERTDKDDQFRVQKYVPEPEQIQLGVDGIYDKKIVI